MNLYFGILFIFCEYFGSYGCSCYGSSFVCFRDDKNYFNCGKPRNVKSKALSIKKSVKDKNALVFNKIGEPFLSIRSDAIKNLIDVGRNISIDLSNLNFIKINKDSFSHLPSTGCIGIKLNDNFTEIDRLAFKDWRCKKNCFCTLYISVKRKYPIKELIFHSLNWKILLDKENTYSMRCYLGAFVQNIYHSDLYTVRFEKGSNKHSNEIRRGLCGAFVKTCSMSIRSKVSVTPNRKFSSLCVDSTKIHIYFYESNTESMTVDSPSWQLTNINPNINIKCFRGAFINNEYISNAYTLKFTKFAGGFIEWLINSSWMNEKNCSNYFIKCNKNVPAKVCFKEKVTRQIAAGNVLLNVNHADNTGIIKIDCNGQKLMDNGTVGLAEWNLTFNNCRNMVKCFKGAFINNEYRSNLFTVQFTKSTSVNTDWLDVGNCSDYIKCDKDPTRLLKNCFKEKNKTVDVTLIGNLARISSLTNLTIIFSAVIAVANYFNFL